MIKIDCQKYADEIINQVKQLPNKKKRLLILTAGDNPASASYMKGKQKDCERSGIDCSIVRVEDQAELIMQVTMANMREDVGGIIIQLPLPEGFDESIVDLVRFYKDVDGFKHNSRFLPCTPEGILHILDNELGDLSGKKVLLIGKGKLVGRPLIDLLLERGCTLTVAHSKTSPLFLELATYHDAVITAVGKPRLVDLKYVKAKVVIDAGISRDENGKLCGDCFNFDPDDGSNMKVTTVPNGIGLMTRAMLMKHMGEVNKR